MKRLLVLALCLYALPTLALAVEPEGAGRMRIQLVARQQATLSSEIAARIEKLPLRDGDAFQEGDLLVQFDCALQEAQLHKAEAAAESARSALQVNKKLAEMNSISTLELDQSAAKVKETEAERSAMQVTVSKCNLKAPYNGRIAKLHADPHQYLTPGKPLMDILDTSTLEVRLIVPSRWLVWLKPGSRFTVQIEELGGRSYPAQVKRVGAKIDPLSQTLPIAGEITGAYPELLPGMSGWASFGGGRRK